jgi:hypothetical protein
MLKAPQFIGRLHLTPTWLGLLLCGLQGLGLSPAAHADAAQPETEIFHFATVGDSRADPKNASLSPQDKRWVQATPVLARILREVNQSHAQALVFNGDMVMGYTPDATQLEREYAFWRGMVAVTLEAGTYVLPVPGNHEVQMPVKQADGASKKLAQANLENAWRDNMGDLILDVPRWQKLTGQTVAHFEVDNSPAQGQNSVSTSQRQLSYSFDAGPIHFAVINTDPVGGDSQAPSTWLQNDLNQAQARGMKHLFVFGHKMAFTYQPPSQAPRGSEGLDEYPALAETFWQVIESHGATYFCGHEHIQHASQPKLAQGGHAWQVIVGSGGSPFAAGVVNEKNPHDRDYAWADVRVYSSGRVHVEIWGFDEHLGPTHRLQAWDI